MHKKLNDDIEAIQKIDISFPNGLLFASSNISIGFVFSFYRPQSTDPFQKYSEIIRIFQQYGVVLQHGIRRGKNQVNEVFLMCERIRPYIAESAEF